MLRSLLIFIAFIACSIVSAQNGSISGVILDKNAQNTFVLNNFFESGQLNVSSSVDSDDVKSA